MLHPHFDPSTITDDQLYDKLNKAYQYLSQQEQLGHNPTVASIQHAILALENEKMSRFEAQMAAETDKHNEDLLKPINLGTIENEDDNDENR